MTSSASVSSILDCSPEKINGFKLRRLIIDGGTQALRNVFEKCHPGKSIQTVLAAYQHILNPLKGKVINQTQWDYLYPTPPNIADINKFDVTLLSVLLRNICPGLTAPATGWGKEPNASDTSDEANIVRIRLFRNEVHAHISETGVSTKDFNCYWNKISPVLVSLGIDQEEINRLKIEECGKEFERVINEWNAMDDDFKIKDLKRIEIGQEKTLRISSDTQQTVLEYGISLQKIEENQKVNKRLLTDLHEQQQRCMFNENRQGNLAKFQKELSDTKSNVFDVVLKKLASCDFTSERERLCKKFINGTREWVFKRIFAWLNDDSTEDWAFVIIGKAGMGKSVIAAVLCERMNSQFAGCFFCRYNNNRYNDPKILLQSLALQLCNVLAEYKKALVDQLSRNSKDLNDLNIEGLFSILLKEPLARISHVEKNFLFVIDAVDEVSVDESCNSEARRDFVELIATHLSELPKFIRFLITTRPENNIVDKFKLLNTRLDLEEYKEFNEKDLRVFFETKLSDCPDTIPSQVYVQELTSKCDGLMLYAFFLFDIFKEGKNLESFPVGLNNVFETYFKRLEKECKSILKIDEDTFLSFLSAMVVANKSLPLDFVVSILGVKTDTPSAKRNVLKALNCISLLFDINDKHISFFHKSVTDWLVCDDDHFYKIDEKIGHVVLAKLCAEFFEKLLKTRYLETSKVTGFYKYALQHGFSHMIEDDVNFDSYLNSYFGNFEIVYLYIMSQETGDGLAVELNCLSEMIYERYGKNSVVDKLKELAASNALFHQSEATFLDGSFPSFLQQFISQKGDTSFKALQLFKRMYPHLPYFERVYKYDEDVNWESILLPSKEEFSTADVHNRLDYVVMCFVSGLVMLISIKPFERIWSKTISYCSSIAFHPHHEWILPGRLDRVLSLTDGSWQRGPFLCEENYFFTDICFSLDNNVMITGNDIDSCLILWDLISGNKVSRIDFGISVISSSFSPDGNYLAVLLRNNGICTWSLCDIKSNYKIIQSSTLEKNDYGTLMCNQSNSWLLQNPRPFSLSSSHDVAIVKNNGSFSEITVLFSSCVFFPPSRKARVIQERLSTSQIVSNPVCFHIFRHDCHIICHDELHLGFIKCDILTLRDVKTTSGNVSFDSQFFYQHHQSLRELKVFWRNGKDWTSRDKNVQNVSAFAIVKNSVFIITSQRNIEIWDVEMSKCLNKGGQVEMIECCESVSDYLVACVGKAEVNFLDSRSLQVVSTSSLSENQNVLACSSRYEVVVKYFILGKKECFIMRDNKKIYSLNDPEKVDIAGFSPNGNKLAVCSFSGEYRRCFEISAENCLTVIWNGFLNRYLGFDLCERIFFIDDDYLMFCKKDELIITNPPSSKIVIILSLRNWPISVFYNRETQTLIVNYPNNKFEEYHFCCRKNVGSSNLE